MSNEEWYIGYEVELDSSITAYREESIAKDLWLNFKTFINSTHSTIPLKMSSEYYSTTIEFNFIKKLYSESLNKKIKLFIVKVMKKFTLREYWRAPSFVWTHLHFFRSKVCKIPTDILLRITLQFILDNSDDLNIYSLDRIICSHQLWGNYTLKVNNDIERSLGSRLGRRFDYSYQSANRPKYRPVINSPRTASWKLSSVEIRIIPTEFILNWKITELIKLLMGGVAPSYNTLALYNKIIDVYQLRIKNAVK